MPCPSVVSDPPAAFAEVVPAGVVVDPAADAKEADGAREPATLPRFLVLFLSRFVAPIADLDRCSFAWRASRRSNFSMSLCRGGGGCVGVSVCTSWFTYGRRDLDCYHSQA